MYLSTIDLYELGQYLRIVLWICLPLIIISLLVTTWLHYRRRGLDTGGLRLSVEGLDNAMAPENAREPERMTHLPGDSLSYQERDPADHEGGDHSSSRDPAGNEADDAADNDQWGKESVSEWKGKDNIYQGILWMKEKYEQYRDQADQRYELLKEELSRSERRYQDLLVSLEENKNRPSGVGQQREVISGELNAGEGEVLAAVAPAEVPVPVDDPIQVGDLGPVDDLVPMTLAKTMVDGDSATDTVKLAALEAQHSQVCQQLDSRQVIIDELEEQLHTERLKVEELVAKLQTNSQLLQNIYQELDKSFHIPKEIE